MNRRLKGLLLFLACYAVVLITECVVIVPFWFAGTVRTFWEAVPIILPMIVVFEGVGLASFLLLSIEMMVNGDG